MKCFWWTRDGRLMKAMDRWNYGDYYGGVDELLAEGYAEVSLQTAERLGWPI